MYKMTKFIASILFLSSIISLSRSEVLVRWVQNEKDGAVTPDQDLKKSFELDRNSNVWTELRAGKPFATYEKVAHATDSDKVVTLYNKKADTYIRITETGLFGDDDVENLESDDFKLNTGFWFLLPSDRCKPINGRWQSRDGRTMIQNLLGNSYWVEYKDGKLVNKYDSFEFYGLDEDVIASDKSRGVFLKLTDNVQAIGDLNKKPDGPVKFVSLGNWEVKPGKDRQLFNAKWISKDGKTVISQKKGSTTWEQHEDGKPMQTFRLRRFNAVTREATFTGKAPKHLILGPRRSLVGQTSKDKHFGMEGRWLYLPYEGTPYKGLYALWRSGSGDRTFENEKKSDVWVEKVNGNEIAQYKFEGFSGDKDDVVISSSDRKQFLKLSDYTVLTGDAFNKIELFKDNGKWEVKPMQCLKSEGGGVLNTLSAKTKNRRFNFVL